MSEQIKKTINAPVVGDVSGGTVQVSNTVNNHQHQHQHQHQHDHYHQHDHHHAAPAFALTAPPAPPARQGRNPKPPKRDVTPAMRDVLSLMHPLTKPTRIDVLTWMRIEFGTSLVLDLEPRELLRLRAHVLSVRQCPPATGALRGVEMVFH